MTRDFHWLVMYVYVVSYVIFIQRKIDNVLNFNPSKFQLKRNKSSIFIAFSVLPIFVYWIFLDIINRGKSAEKNRGKQIGGKIASRVKPGFVRLCLCPTVFCPVLPYWRPTPKLFKMVLWNHLLTQPFLSQPHAIVTLCDNCAECCETCAERCASNLLSNYSRSAPLPSVRE